MSVRPLLSGLAKNERGSTAIIFALCAVALAGFVGAAVDGARWFSMRRQHALAVDNALLAAARHLQVQPTDSEGALDSAALLYKTNLKNATQLTNNTVKFVQADTNASITFTGKAYLTTSFLNVVGIQTLDVTTPAKAVFNQSGLNSGTNLEIALMLDVTGSMCDDGTGPCNSGVKITGAKQAATDLVTIVLGQASSSYTSRIALVPFSSAVRIDADGTSNPLMQTLTGMPKTFSGWFPSWSCSGGSGSYVGEIWVGTSGTCTMTPVYSANTKLIPCVTERSFDSGSGFDPGDSAPASGNWLLAHGGDRSPYSWDSTNTALTQYTGTSAADVTHTWNYTTDGSGCMSQPGNEILPLTSNQTDVTNRLSTLTAFGPTAGALGTVWTQYLLSPNWSGIWTGSQRPGSYQDTQTKQANGAPILRKVAVLMTDGGFNTNRQFAEDSATQMQAVSNNAISVCTNMKKNGIEIYAVGFALNTLGATERSIATTTLKACGTDISHFYDSISVEDLKSAFRDIALKLTPVRLSQ